MHDHITGNTTFSKTIEVVVLPTGESKIETKGFVGGECREASRFIEEALGPRASEKLTSQYHQSLPNLTQAHKAS